MQTPRVRPARRYWVTHTKSQHLGRFVIQHNRSLSSRPPVYPLPTSSTLRLPLSTPTTWTHQHLAGDNKDWGGEFTINVNNIHMDFSFCCKSIIWFIHSVLQTHNCMHSRLKQNLTATFILSLLYYMKNGTSHYQYNLSLCFTVAHIILESTKH